MTNTPNNMSRRDVLAAAIVTGGAAVGADLTPQAIPRLRRKTRQLCQAS